ncbi:MAG: molybdopterin-dependent oxidoreductase [Candidatus Heimdallarchaeota archaeon]|nr:molybdopterin-dependent oxidoreductase [Candidatus Heimdallarchaeota archaeon]
MKNIDSYSHVRGESIYVDDIPVREDTLFGVVFASKIANGKIISINTTNAEQVDGVFRIITDKDIPGENQIGSIFPDEELFASDKVDFIGQPLGLILAKSEKIARDALETIEVEIEPEIPVVDPRIAADKGLLIHDPRTFEIGDISASWDNCDIIVEGKAESGGQEHLYIETQGAYAFPIENDAIKVISSTQGPTQVQKALARVIGQPMHKVQIDVQRLGGGFGGKEDQATAWGCMAGLATYITKRPVKLIPNRLEDLRMTGKRHPYTSDYKLGLSNDGKILSYEVIFYQNSGAAADLSPAVLERTLFHANNTYFIPNMKATAYPCRTNLPPNTAFRGFGGPQGMFVIESALAHAADVMQLDRDHLQKINLLDEGDSFHYGQVAVNPTAKRTWEEAETRYNLLGLKNRLQQFNAENVNFKRGLAVMPICFGISFTKTMLNQAGALVHIYMDGSLSIATGAVEMGQGVTTRVAQVPMKLFSLPIELVKIESTNTTRVANTSPSAASATHDLNGRATQIACEKIKSRLITLSITLMGLDETAEIIFDESKVRNSQNDQTITWKELILEAYLRRIDLSAHGLYSVPKINFDTTIEKGSPFAYYSYGTAFIEITLDCIRGTYVVDHVKVVHDFGKSMNNIIDLGQMEGGIVQGIGWMTSEDLVYDDSGKLQSNALSTYKIPDIYAAPKEIHTHFLENAENEFGLFKSKAIGEPPLLYGLGVYFAIRNAVKAFNPKSKIGFMAPITPEKVLLNLYDGLTLRSAKRMDNSIKIPTN